MQAFFDAFGRLEQRVIMRLEGVEGISVPENVVVESAVPQQAILAHAKTVAFFTQGGANSVAESVHHRVPMVVMPVWWDNGDNARFLREKGAAAVVEKGASAEEIFDAVVRVMRDAR